MEDTTTKRDWLLLALAFADGPLSPVQLQKALFLFFHKIPAIPAEFYEFAPYNYGPFCQEIYSDAEMLQLEGLASIEEGPNQVRQYTITADGKSRADFILQVVSGEAVKHAKQITIWVRAQSFRGLVSAIYKEYPEYMAHSIFKG